MTKQYVFFGGLKVLHVYITSFSLRVWLPLYMALSANKNVFLFFSKYLLYIKFLIYKILVFWNLHNFHCSVIFLNFKGAKKSQEKR